jgi:hypothetical protein
MDLYNYVQPKVTAVQSAQHPIFKADVEDNFAVALAPAGARAVSAVFERPTDDFEYDVFISYRQKEPDESWVYDTLWPHLEAKGLKVFIDERDFRLGAPLLKEIERAVVNSRYTLAVLTPVYLESNWTDLENVLARHLGTEKGQRRMIAIMREKCEPDLDIRMRLWLDMTRDDRFERDLARLVSELRQPVDA